MKHPFSSITQPAAKLLVSGGKSLTVAALVAMAIGPVTSKALAQQPTYLASPDKDKDKDKGKAGEKPKEAPKEAPAKDDIKPLDEVVKKCRKMPGLFPLYQDTTNGSLYMQVGQSQLGKEFIYFVHTVDGVSAAGHYRGSYRGSTVFSINKHYSRLEFTVHNTGFYFDSTTALSKAAKANISDATLHSGAIVGQNKDKTEFLIKADELFLTEAMHPVKPRPVPGLPPGMGFSLGNLSKDKTKYGTIRNYPENLDIVSQYVYDNPMPGNGGGADVTDARAITISVQHSVIQMPKNDFKPRKDDARVGYFGQETEDMTSTSATPYRDFINRWHLVKKDPKAAISEPVEPITWWLEKTTPKELRPTIIKAGLAWNQAFEAAGFRNAVVMKEQPDTATWDAGDIRYNVLRWTSSPNPPFGGYGPSFTNPRTGQILGADIMLEWVFMTNKLVQSDIFETAGWPQFSKEASASMSQSLDQWHKNHQANHHCEAGHLLHHQLQAGLSSLEAMDASAVDTKRFIDEGLYYLILHEMGHTMGLMHNMKASQLHGIPAIYDRSITEPVGLTGSVMDYPAANLPLDKAKPIQYFTTRPGPYDVWAIQYGYSPALEDPAAEAARLENILKRSHEPALAFGNDADDMRAPGKATDPRVNVGDLSSDAITFAVNRMKQMNVVLPKLKGKYLKQGGTYHELRDRYLRLTGERAIHSGVISRYVGGVYVERANVGQKATNVAYTPVALADQKRAMAALNTYLFAPDVTKAETEYYNILAQQRRGFNFFRGSEAPNITGRLLSQQESVLEHLLHPEVQNRLVNAELYGNAYRLNDMMADLTAGIFRADLASGPNVFRQNLQNAYVERLISMAGLGKRSNAAYAYASNAAALAQLNSIKAMLATPAPNLDASARAHRTALTFKINKAMKGDA